MSASIAFTYDQNGGGFSLQEIGLAFTTEIPIGDTGIFVTYIGGEVDGIGTQNWSVSGSIGLTFGDTISIDGNNYSVAAAVGSFTLDRNELVLSGQVAFAGDASSSNPPQLSSLLGIVTGSATFDWNDGIYSLQVNGSFADGTFTVAGEFKYDQGDFLLEATAGLHVPDGIPVIGGDLLGSASFVFQYQHDSPNPSQTNFFAAWVDLPVLGNVLAWRCRSTAAIPSSSAMGPSTASRTASHNRRFTTLIPSDFWSPTEPTPINRPARRN